MQGAPVSGRNPDSWPGIPVTAPIQPSASTAVLDGRHTTGIQHGRHIRISSRSEWDPKAGLPTPTPPCGRLRRIDAAERDAAPVHNTPADARSCCVVPYGGIGEAWLSSDSAVPLHVGSPAPQIYRSMAKRVERIGLKRPWRVLAAPIPRDWDLVITELESEFGAELYALVRQVRLVADCPAHRREKLFRKGNRHIAERRTEALHEAPSSIRPSLQTLMRITGSNPPTDREAAVACEAIALWAQDEGYADTAVHYAEAAAAIAPTDPYFGFVAGRTNRVIGIPWRAEVFYSRAIRHGYRQQNWDVYVRANLGLGRLHADRGRVRVAAKHFFTAARAAVDQGQDWLAAQTYHDLFPLHYELGDLKKAHEVAHRALATYPQHHERYPLAVHDYLLLLILENHFAEAWPILERLVQAPLRPHDKVIVWGTIARVAGALQKASAYAEAEAQVLELAPHWDAFAPAAYLGLAAGAHGLRDRALAASYASRASLLADAKDDRQARRLAQELLDQLASAIPHPPPVPLSGGLAEGLRSLICDKPTAEEAAPDGMAAGALAKLSTWRSDSTWTARENQHGLWTLGPV